MKKIQYLQAVERALIAIALSLMVVGCSTDFRSGTPASEEPAVDAGVASLRPCLEPERVDAGTEYYCPDGTLRLGTREEPELESPDPAIILAGNIVNGVAGTFSPDFPDAANVRSNDTTNGVTGTYEPDFPDPANVRTIDTTDGVTGTFSPDFPDVTNVRDNDTTNGVTGGIASCAADGDDDCYVPSATALKVADTSNIDEWDFRKKRASDGSVITFAGLEGKMKNCRNRANLTTGPDGLNSSDNALPYNNTTSPASGTLVPDFFDTIDDYNDNQTGLPPDLVPWTIAGVTGTHGEDFTCGGVYATGAKDYSDGSPTPTGADAANLHHDPHGNWQDLTPGILPGGANSTNTNPGCNASDKHCVFRELISGLMVTEVASPRLWQEAIDYCHNLGEAGNADATDAIPTLDVGLGTAHSDWRLPTQKELTHLSTAGIRGLNQTSDLVTFYGDVDNWFWSASSQSSITSGASSVRLHDGGVGNFSNDNTFRVVCVR